MTLRLTKWLLLHNLAFINVWGTALVAFLYAAHRGVSPAFDANVQCCALAIMAFNAALSATQLFRSNQGHIITLCLERGACLLLTRKALAISLLASTLLSLPGSFVAFTIKEESWALFLLATTAFTLLAAVLHLLAFWLLYLTLGKPFAEQISVLGIIIGFLALCLMGATLFLTLDSQQEGFLWLVGGLMACVVLTRTLLVRQARSMPRPSSRNPHGF